MADISINNITNQIANNLANMSAKNLINDMHNNIANILSDIVVNNTSILLRTIQTTSYIAINKISGIANKQYS